MTKIKIDGKEVNAEVCNNVAVFKSKGWRARHYPTEKALGDPKNTRVFETKEQAMRFAWGLQERLNLNVKRKEEFLAKNGGLIYERYCGIAEEEFERSKI
jgi:hypothetical protein